MTDSLLMKIEESETWHQAFGFVRTTSKVNTGQGKKVHEHYLDLAMKLFHNIDSPKEWMEFDIKDLGNVVKNQIAKQYIFISIYHYILTNYSTFHSLKKAFWKHHMTLKETGHGLIVHNQEAAITPDSEIANAWGTLLVYLLLLTLTFAG